MDTLQAQKISELVKEHNLPPEIVGRCVAADGLVDNERLGIALQSSAFGKSGRGAVDQVQVESLKAAYAEAEKRGDNVAMIGIKRRVFELGGRI
jgi:hypothetical protein